MKFIIAGLLSALLIWLAPNTPTSPAKINKQEAAKPQVATVEKVKQPTHPQTEKTVVRPVATQATQPVVINGCDNYLSTFQQYDWNVRMALAICKAESGGNVYALSATADRGLMQINSAHANLVNYDLGQLYNPYTNIRVAYQVYKSQGWYGWSTYNNGSVWRYY